MGNRNMRRRDLISVVVAALWPLGAACQQSTLPVIGFLNAGATQGVSPLFQPYRDGLAAAGFVEGKNVSIEYRIADGALDRLPDLAADLVQRHVSLIAAGGGIAPAVAAMKATSTTPIVFTIGSDPVKAGLVASYNRPGGNVTGIAILLSTLESKRMELLHEMAPNAMTIGILQRRGDPVSTAYEAARRIKLEPIIEDVGDERDLDTVFSSFAGKGAGAVLIGGSDPSLAGWSTHIIALAERYKLPTIYSLPEISSIGGLISYGPDIRDVYRQAGTYAGRILAGEKPADLPVLQPTKFKLVINLKTAKTLGLAVPTPLLATADEVIE
jgi:putative ABC transport system substrate-binding protein